MKADTLNFARLFGADVQYVVPMFQRPYVWNKERQWEPLWQDVMDVVESLLDAEERYGSKSDAEESVAPHFLGAVVLDPLHTPPGHIDSRHVIDGQQRLTTMQLMIAAFRSVAQSYPELARHERVFEKLIRNDDDLIDDSRPDEKFKVWPTKFDRDSFRAVMTGTDTVDGRPAEAFRYFRDVCTTWAAEAADKERLVRQFDALQAVVRGYLKLVAIDLEANDNAQAIFEVLNARGTELLAVDLVKNLGFRAGQENREDVDQLYHSYWKKFDSEEWRREVRVGRLKKARADQFLGYWLVMKSARDVHAQQLFPVFRRLLQEHDGTIRSLMEDLSWHADQFDEFDRYPVDSAEGQFFYRINEIDITTLMPLLLMLFGFNGEQLPVSKRRWALQALESWLVRRALIRSSTKDYNKVVPMLIGRIHEDPSHAAEIVVKSLREMEGPNREWPTDERIREHLRVDPTYASLKRGRLRMVLEAIEDHLRGERSEQRVPLNRLHIEHILPQRWIEHWPLAAGAGPMAGGERDLAKHRLGNLTLLTEKLNIIQSNSDWETKRQLLSDHSVLLLNRVIQHADAWGEKAIEERTEWMIDIILEVWPGPHDLKWLGGP